MYCAGGSLAGDQGPLSVTTGQPVRVRALDATAAGLVQTTFSNQVPVRGSLKLARPDESVRCTS